jgi:hypothetical protein
MKKTGLNNIVMEPTEAPGIRWGAYARVKLAMDDGAGNYPAPVTVNSCHARQSSEGLMKADENCHLVIDNRGCICLVATKMILPGQALLTRYGFKHWMHPNWPLHLLEAMFVKYTATVNREGNADKGDDEEDDEDTITNEQVAIWQNIIDKKQADDAKHRAIRPISILYSIQRTVDGSLMLGFFWVILTNTCPDSENVCLIVEYFYFQQHE